MTASRLEPCPCCTRHVRISETACPFCGAALGVAFRARPARVAPRGRLGRTAVFAFGAALAVTACGEGDGDGAPPPLGDMGGSGDSGGDDLGTPRVDMGDESDLGGVAPLYGAPAPPPDGGNADAGDGGGIAPLYGLPPEPG